MKKKILVVSMIVVVICCIVLSCVVNMSRQSSKAIDTIANADVSVVRENTEVSKSNLSSNGSESSKVNSEKENYTASVNKNEESSIDTSEDSIITKNFRPPVRIDGMFPLQFITKVFDDHKEYESELVMSHSKDLGITTIDIGRTGISIENVVCDKKKGLNFKRNDRYITLFTDDTPESKKLYGKQVVRIYYNDGSIDNITVTVLKEIDERGTLSHISSSSPLTLEVTNRKFTKAKVLDSEYTNKVAFTIKGNNTKLDIYVPKVEKNIKYGCVDIAIYYDNSEVKLLKLSIDKETVINVRTTNCNGAVITAKVAKNKTIKQVNTPTKHLYKLYKGNYIISIPPATSESFQFVIEYTDGSNSTYYICSRYDLDINKATEVGQDVTFDIPGHVGAIKYVKYGYGSIDVVKCVASEKSITFKTKRSGSANVQVTLDDTNTITYHIDVAPIITYDHKDMKLNNSLEISYDKDIDRITSDCLECSKTSDRGIKITASSRGSSNVYVYFKDGNETVIVMNVTNDNTYHKVLKVNDNISINVDDKIETCYSDDTRKVGVTLDADNKSFIISAKESGSAIIDVTTNTGDKITYDVVVRDVKVHRNNTLWVGDSRTVGMNGTFNNSLEVIAKVGEGYYFMDSHRSEILEKRGYNIIFNMGCNDLGNINNYLNWFNSLPDEFVRENNIYVMSVNPVEEEKSKTWSTIENGTIKWFNANMKQLLRKDITYIDAYDYMICNPDYWLTYENDGVHYTGQTNINIYNYIFENYID